MHGISGAIIAVLLDTAALNAKVTAWDVEQKVNMVDDTGAGDPAKSRLAGIQDWEATVECIILDATDRHLTAAGTPSVATISRNFWPNSVLVA